jgi:uncharacterized protein (DUF934 family)
MRFDPTTSGWLVFDGDAGTIPPGADVLIPLDEWRERAAVWRTRAGRIGLLLAASDDRTAVRAERDQFDVVAVAAVARESGRALPVWELLEPDAAAAA